MISGGKGKKRTDCASGNRETDIAFHTKDGSHICCNVTMTDIPKDKDKDKYKNKDKGWKLHLLHQCCIDYKTGARP